MQAVQLRDYQREAVEASMLAVARGDDPLIVHATGTGKTTTSSETARQWVAEGHRVLVMAHRRELLKQLKERMESFGLRVGLERGRQSAGDAPVVVSSVQTMVRRLDKFRPGAFTRIIVDEAHHTPSPSYRQVLDHFQKDPRCRVLGVTATPDRADGVALGSVYETVASRYEIDQAVAEGHLVPARGLRVVVEGFDLSSVRQKVIKNNHPEHTPVEGWGRLPPSEVGEVRDLHPGDLSAAAVKPEAVEGVVGPLMELAEHRKTIVFACSVAHCKAIVAAIEARGGTAKAVYHGMGEDREKVQDDFRAGKYQFLVNVMILTEGVDIPAIECVAMVRPTQSRALYAQAAGRGLRPCDEIGKRECLLLDFVGVSCQHDLVGPEDVLGGALVGGEVRVLKKPAPKATDKKKPGGEYKPTGLVARFKVAVVELVRRVGRALVRSMDPRRSLVQRTWDRVKKRWEEYGDD